MTAFLNRNLARLLLAAGLAATLATVVASGFSTKTWAPASIARIAMSAWLSE